jgi:hypothetical protein
VVLNDAGASVPDQRQLPFTASALLIIVAAVAGWVSWRRYRRSQTDKPLTAAAMRLWQRSWYCARCDTVFIPGRAAFPRTNLARSLRSAARADQSAATNRHQ